MEKIKQIVELLKQLAGICVDEPKPERVLAVAEVLASYDLKDLTQAIHELKRTIRYFPAPVDVIALMKDPDDTAEEYWALIMGHVRRVGHWGASPILPSHVKRALDSIGGINAICQSQVSELSYLARQFKLSCSAFIESNERHELRLTAQESRKILDDVYKKTGTNLLGPSAKEVN